MHKPEFKSINIEPDDWLWATWRPRIPRSRPEPTPFDQEAALAHLRNLPVQGCNFWNWSKIWSKLLSAVSLSQAEAHFWFLAIAESCLARHQKPEELADRLARQSFTGGLSLEQVRSAMASAHLRLTKEMLLLLIHLLPPEDITELMMEEIVCGFLPPIFRRQVLPYLTDTQAEALRQQLCPKLEPAKWPTSGNTIPSAAFYLAAQLGMDKEVQTLVESWPDDLYYKGYQYNHLKYLHQPQEIVFGLGNASLVESQTRRLQLYLSQPDYIRAWLAHTEYSALDWVKCSILERADKKLVAQLLETFALVKAPEAAPHMLELMQSLVLPQATQWLDENPTHAIAGLIPVAARQSHLAISAVKFLQRMRRKGYEATIRSRIESEALTIPESVRSSILKQDFTELDNNTTPEWLHKALTNAETPKKSKFQWIEPADLPPITIKQHCLNSNQMILLLLALQHSTFDHPHLLVTTLKANCESTVLDTFVWELFERWLQVGAPSKEKWALVAVGLLGNDASVLKLASLIRVWPGESQHKRAVLGLQALQAIGTDTALMQINGIAQKLKFQALKAKAKECVEVIALKRGLTLEQLEDRIVPDCELDERGSRIFDYGSRQFHLVLGAEMKPMVRDSQGNLKTLPHPGEKDDAELASIAITEWKLLKKQLTEVGKAQKSRLERAMIDGRTWQREEFETLLVQHPLMIHLVRSLVWAGYDPSGQLVSTFRVTEDQTYADAEDQSLSLTGIAAVGIVHPAQLSENMRTTWGELLSDYETIPPFRQLSRTVFTLEPAEFQNREITRFQGITVSSVTLVGILGGTGWLRGALQYCKPFPRANVTVVLECSSVLSSYMEADAELKRCFFVPGYPQVDTQDRSAMLLGDIDTVVISEVLRNLGAIASQGSQ